MNIFKSHAREGHSKKKFIGVFIDKKVDLMVNLLSIKMGFSRSELIRVIFDSYFKDLDLTEGLLIRQIARKAYDIFLYKNKYDMDISIEEFEGHLKSNLRKRKVPNSISETILNKFMEHVSKNKRSDEKAYK